MRDLANFIPVQDQWKWSEEDKILFEAALKLHGKSFPSIRLMFPEKTIADLVIRSGMIRKKLKIDYVKIKSCQ